MANIPVERTGGASIWAWLLGILALLALIWLGLELFDEEPDADELAGTEDNVGVIDDVELDAPDIGDAILLEDDLYADYGSADYETDIDVGEPDVLGADVDGDGEIERAGMRDDGTRMGDTRIGRSVDLDEARVLSVVGDSAFFVGSGGDQRVLVVFESLGESETGAGGSDGVFNIDEGEMVSIDGTVARYVEGARGTWELPESERDRLLRQGVYVMVSNPSDVDLADSDEDDA